jgi:hypothetical protein
MTFPKSQGMIGTGMHSRRSEEEKVRGLDLNIGEEVRLSSLSESLCPEQREIFFGNSLWYSLKFVGQWALTWTTKTWKTCHNRVWICALQRK